MNNFSDWRVIDTYSTKQAVVTLKAVIQAQDFDDPSPAIFIMNPGED